VRLAPQAAGTSLFVATMAQLAVFSPYRWQRKVLLSACLFPMVNLYPVVDV